jgi:hypothetical protein
MMGAMFRMLELTTGVLLLSKKIDDKNNIDINMIIAQSHACVVHD